MKIQSIRCAVTVLTAKMIIVFTAHCGLAFSFSYPPLNRIRAFDNYSYRDSNGDRISGFTTPILVEELELGGSDELWELLNAFSDENPGQWEFVRAESDLEGSFELDLYLACGFGTQCGDQGDNGVGLDISLFFYPEGNDPVPDINPRNNNLRWIQRVESNHSLQPDEHGIFENVIDEDFESDRRNPYFFDRPRRRFEPGLGLVVPFDDTPYRVDPDESHRWVAELYLAEIIGREGGTETVKIYNGIKWGWRNRAWRRRLCPDGSIVFNGECPTTPPPPPPPPPPCNGSSGGGGCRSFSAREVPLFDDDFDNDSEEGAPDVEKIEKVPEATSLFGLFALSGWGILQWLKNRKDK